jgi:hypothetical protein
LPIAILVSWLLSFNSFLLLSKDTSGNRRVLPDDKPHSDRWPGFEYGAF